MSSSDLVAAVGAAKPLKAFATLLARESPEEL